MMSNKLKGNEMKKYQAKLTTILTAIILSTSGASYAFQDEGTVRIGSLEAQTGVPAPYGIQALNGSKIAIDEINAAGGVNVAGKKVKLQLMPSPNGYDPGADSALTIALIKKLALEDEVLLIKGTSRSQNTEVAFKYLNEMEKAGTPIVLMSSLAGAPGLGGLSKWGFRNSFSEAGIIDRQIELLSKKFGYKTAGIYVVKDNSHPAIVAQYIVTPILKKYGIEITSAVEGMDADIDLSSQVNALKRANPDIVVVASATNAGVNIMKEAGRRGLKPKIWLGMIGNISPEVPKLGGISVERMIMGSSYSPSLDSVSKLRDEYIKRNKTDINMFGVDGYEAIYLFKEAIEKSGIKNTKQSLQEDREKVRVALQKTEITSITGEKIRFNSDNDAVKKGYILTIQSGRYVEWDQNEFK
jgi:branched-chain amino acid transport system substrate-binding protein